MQKQNRTSFLRDWRMLPLLAMGIAAVILALPALSCEASMRILGQLQLALQLICLLLLGFLMRRARGMKETVFLMLTGLIAVVSLWAMPRLGGAAEQRYMNAVALYGAAGGVVVLLAMLLSPRPFLQKPEWLFLLLAIAFGVPYIFGILPLSAPDEWYHYKVTLTAAAEILHGDTVADPAYLTARGFTAHLNSAKSAATVAGGLMTETLTGTLEPFGSLELYVAYPLAYAPQILGSMLAMALGVNRIGLYLMGDMANFVFYVAVVYMAVRIIPKWKTTLAMVGVLPMALQQAASFSSDGFINAMAYLLIAQILRIAMKREKICWRNVLPLTLTAMLMAPAKAVYACMLLTLLILPMDCYRNRRQKWLFLVGVCTATAVAVLAFQLPKILETLGGGPSAEAASTHFTLSYALSHPAETVRIFVGSHSPNILYALAETAVGRQLSGLSLNLYYGDAWCLLLILVASAVCKHPGEPVLRGRDRVTLLASSALVYLAVLATMLFAWTNIGDTSIQGVQGRYFLPIIPMILAAMQSGNISAKKDFSRWLVCGFSLVSVMVILEIVFRTFEP